MLRKVKLISAEGAVYLNIGCQPNGLVNQMKKKRQRCDIDKLELTINHPISWATAQDYDILHLCG